MKYIYEVRICYVDAFSNLFPQTLNFVHRYDVLENLFSKLNIGKYNGFPFS